MSKEIPLGLKTALESSQCVLFVGAGIGSCAKDADGRAAPDGSELAAAIASHFKLEQFGEASLAEIAQLAEIRHGRAELESFIADQLRGMEPDENLLWLFSLKWKAIFTTNYDSLIQEAYSKLESPRQKPVSISATSELTTPDPDLEVGIYHLHGSLFHGEKAAILITEEDYARFRERRRMLFELLKIQFATSTILYVGYSNQDPNWRTVLAELRAEFSPKSPPVSYRVAPRTSKAESEILKARGVETIDCTLQEFVASAKMVVEEERLDASNIEVLRANVPGDLAPKFDEAPAPVVRLLDGWIYVNQAEFDEAPNIQAFLNGEAPNWALVAAGHQFERDVQALLYEAILDLVTATPRVGVLLLLAPAGYGVSTILMSLAARLVADKAGPVFMHKKGTPLAEGDMLFASGIADSPTIFFVDNASDHKPEVAHAIQRLKEAKRPSFLVLGERLNEWNQRNPRISGKEFRIEPLSDTEIPRLLEVLDQNNALGQLEHLSPEMRIAAIREKHEKQLLVAMREATEGKSFDAIIEDEYRGIDEPLGQQLYAAVCCGYQIRLYVRDEVLSKVLEIDLPRLYERTRESTEGIVEFDSVDPRRGIYAARARHHIIAQVVWERCVPEVAKAQNIERILSALNLSYHTDVQLLDGLIRNDLIVDSIRGLEGKTRFFETAAKKLPDNPYVLQHYARMLLRQGNPELALAQIEQAIAMDDRMRVLHHTKGKVLAELAHTAQSNEIARRWLVQSEAAFRRSMSLNDRDPYPYQSLAELYLEWAKRVSDETESVDYLTKAEEVIGEGLKKVWDREGLWIISSAIQRWLGNKPEATVILERAVAENPGSVVARYILGARYLEAREPDKAVQILESIVSANPNEFRPCVAYAVAQVESGETYEKGIASLRLGELFGLRDARFIATLAGMQFMNGQFTDAEDTWRKAADREFSFEALTTVRYLPPMEPGRRDRFELEGEVVSVRRGYAFVRCPGYPDIFCPGSKFGTTLMEPGLKVTFGLGFSARGPVALNPRASRPS